MISPLLNKSRPNFFKETNIQGHSLRYQGSFSLIFLHSIPQVLNLTIHWHHVRRFKTRESSDPTSDQSNYSLLLRRREHEREKAVTESPASGSRQPGLNACLHYLFVARSPARSLSFYAPDHSLQNGENHRPLL